MTTLVLPSFLCLALIATFKGCLGLKIVNLAVPVSVPNTTDTPLLLDCDYSLELSSAEGLVVKWFLNEPTKLVYQWIQGRRPQDLGVLKGRVDLNYRASEDPRKMFRALKIVHPGPDISGLYTCYVSTFMDEAKETKRMTIYTPASKFEFSQKEEGEEITLHCSATGVYPQPNFNITSNDEKSGSLAVDVEISNKNGLYDCEAELKLSKKDLASRTSFQCGLSITYTDYNLTKTITIPPASRVTPTPEGFRTSQVSAPEAGYTVPNHYDPDIFFIRTYQDGASSGSSIEAAAFSIFLLSFLTVRL